ncbi:HsmA family protein [Pelosinus sp. sgz500959]|uniref:HsmA family protein n=1 Tax=Pelosinus sp. sgz500959 TaxID=3242472 RepID=UPI00366A952C
MSQGIIFINLAFVLYTVGVWSEKIQGQLKKGHLFLFWFGVFCDMLGTSAMRSLNNNHIGGGIQNIFDLLPIYKDFHSLTGFIALVLMLLHVCWATIILFTKKRGWIKKFHRYSFMVWIIWLIPFLSGMLFHLR